MPCVRRRSRYPMSELCAVRGSEIPFRAEAARWLSGFAHGEGDGIS